MNDIIFVGETATASSCGRSPGMPWRTATGHHVAPEDPAMADFFANYKKTYNDECKIRQRILAYDSIYWLADASKGPARSTARHQGRSREHR